MNVDLHCHSNVSDGLLAPAELVRRAAAQGVDVLALTDHDQIDGLEAARAAAREAGIAFVDGVEISVSWHDTTVHVVGLRIDASHAGLGAALQAVRGGRIERARRMARDLEMAGIEGSFEGAMRHADNPQMVSRTHFARFLVASGRSFSTDVANVNSVKSHRQAVALASMIDGRPTMRKNVRPNL